MLTIENKRLKNSMVILLILALILSEPFLFSGPAYADKVVLSEKTYYHLDMGVQLSYNSSSSWGNRVHGSILNGVEASISFNSNIEVLDVYPLESSKGSSFDFNGKNTSHNIPSTLVRNQGNDAAAAYDEYYSKFVSSSMTAGDFSASGKSVTFSYDVKLSTAVDLEVVEYGTLENDDEVYKLFGGKSALEKDQPVIANAVEKALDAGLHGTAGGNKLYLTFCPTVIVYKKYVTVGDLEAQLELPKTAKQGETYLAEDNSLVDDSLTVSEALLEKSYDGGNTWLPVITWEGTGAKGRNTGESIVQKEQEIGTVTYRLTVDTEEGESDTDTQSIEITDSREIEGKAVLELPETTFEGHPVIASDVSNFTVDGKDYSALRMYNENLASNSFSIKQSGAGTIKKMDWPNRAEAVFKSKGNYNVILNVRIKTNGANLSDTKPIEVLKTPSILDGLGGVQKQNRRQDLYANIATHPYYPISESWVKIENVQTGESIIHTYRNGTVAFENSARIKSRAMETVADHTDQYFTYFDLPFLTKPISPGASAVEQYKYTIYVKDTKGDTDTVTKTFTVNPDLAPVPSISLDSMYLREKDSNTAVITAEDMTVSADGDQVKRSWGSSSGLAGYQDLSFGSGKKISFQKTGVGVVTVNLTVKDKWTEPTLEEFINPQDYLSASTQSGTLVGNVGPVVRLEPIFPATGELLILAGDDVSYNQAVSSKATFLEEFLRQEMDVAINVRKMETPTTGLEGIAKLQTLLHRFGYEGGRGYQFLGKAVAIDNSKAYVVEATWPGTGQGQYPTGPYKLLAYNPKTGALVWSCTISTASFTIGQDDTDTYLYIIYSNKTVIIDKTTGSILTTISNFQFGEKSFVTDSNIYTVKDTGIYAVSRKSGAVRLATDSDPVITGKEPLGIQSVRRISGNLQFVERKGSTLYRTSFGLSDESKTREILTAVPTDGYSYEVTVMGIDTEGKIGIFMADKTSSTEAPIYAIIFDKNNQEKRRVVVNGYGSTYSAYAVPNAKGVFDVFVTDTLSAGSSKRYCNTTFYNIADSKSVTKEFTMSKGSVDNPAYWGERLVYARDTGNAIEAGFGGDFQYLVGMGYIFYDKIREYKLDKSTWTVTYTAGGGLKLLDIADQYGVTSETYSIVNSADNSLDESAQLRTKLLGWNQTVTQIAERNVNKYLTNSAELDMEGYLAIIDKSNTGLGEDITSLANSIKSAGVRFLASGQTQAETYLANLVSSLKGTVLDSGSSIPGIRDKLIAEKDSGRKVLKITPSDTTSKLTKSMSFDPSSTYYYEYEVKGQQAASDVLSTSFTTSRQNGVLSYLGNKYYVQKTYFEDFENSSDLNSFFTYSDTSRIKNGRYQAADAKGHGNDYDRSAVRTTTNTVTFTVPTGKTAVLSFDYDMYLWADYERNCGVYIDGTLWDKETFSERDKDKTGTYIHTAKLGPGKHTVSAQIIYYSYGEASSKNTRVHLDNLSVMILGSTALTQSKSSTVNEKGNDWYRVKGSFTTPERIIDFDSLSMTTYFEDFEDDSLIPIMQNSTGTGKNMFAISNGSFGVKSVSNTTGILDITLPGEILWKPYINQTSSGEGNFVYLKAGSVERRNGHYQTYATGTRYYTDFQNGVVQMQSLEGNQRLTIRTGTNRPSAEVQDITIQTFPKIPAATENLYFLDTANNTKPGAISSKFYVPDNQYDGTATITLNMPKSSSLGGAIYLQNLKIYKLVNGVKQYVTDDHFTQTTTAGLNGWKATTATLSIVDQVKKEEKDENLLVYKKGELVKYLAYYSDYEGDPSKKQYWRYIHEPFNDGEHPDAAVIVDASGTPIGGPGLGENLPVNGKPASTEPAVTKVLTSPIERFYIDGKYTVQHWQEDDTSRGTKTGGNPDYDKLSNVVEITFYVEGGGEAPWITSIKTSPVTVKEGASYKLQIGVDDSEKDILELRTEVYKEGKLVYTHTQKNITADSNGNYPITTTGSAPLASAGKYTVVCTVRDWSGVGLGSYAFTVVSEGKITGYVNHTEQWNINRQKYNLAKSGTTESPRAYNVFWSGERFILRAEVAGSPTQVTSQVLSYPSYSTTMYSTGVKNAANETVYAGELWDESMINKWGRKTPITLTFRFTAYYNGGIIKTHDVDVIVDNREDYYRLHRYF